jgi:hypothetical protein
MADVDGQVAVGEAVAAWLPDNGYGTSPEIHDVQPRTAADKQIRQRDAD